MPLQVPDYIRSMVPYVPGKPIEETQREYKIKKVVKLASNENPLGPSPKAIQAVRKALLGSHRYPDGSAFSLKQALASHLGVEPKQILVGNGSNEVIDLIIRTYCIVGDSIVTSKGAFIAYRLCAQIQGVRTHETPLTTDLRFDLHAILEEVKNDERAKIVFIANPNNPTGTFVTSSELRKFLKSLEDVRGGSTLVVLDYAYWEYVTAKDLPDAIELLKEFPQIIVLRTFSKVYGLAGLRMGYGVSSEAIIGDIEKVRQPFNFSSVGLVAAEAALKDKAFVQSARALNKKGLQLWDKSLSRMNVPFWKSQGNFLLADCKAGFGLTGPELSTECLRRGLILRPVANYGMPNAIRISIGTPAENAFAIRVLKEVQNTRRRDE